MILATPQSDEQGWLKANRSLRMDATCAALFDPERAAFHVARYEFAGRLVHGFRVADVACGTGYGSGMMMRAGAASVIGIDLDPDAVWYAAGHHAAGGVTFAAASAECLPLRTSSIDAIVSFETLEHVPCDRTALDEFCRVLVPGGLLICSVPNNWGLSQHHVRNYTRADLLALLQPSFDVRLWNQNSGCKWERNHGQPVGIVPTTEGNHQLAECFIAVGVMR